MVKKYLNESEIFIRNVEKMIGSEEFEKKLKGPKKLRIKYGVDVTAPFLHIGHAVNLWLMRSFQEEGHKVVFLIGDFTTKIGDPTGKTQTRPKISDADIKKGTKEFIKQVSKILLTDKKVFEVRKNSEWFSRMKPAQFIELFSNITHAQIIQRDMFQERIKKGDEIYIHEMLYPIFQGYDSVMIRSDATIIGSDQLFNEMMGRNLQKIFGQDPQTIITTKITPGIHGGPKQSKSLDNYVAIEDSAENKFGKIMSLPDDLIIQYLETYTTMPSAEIEKNKKELEDKKINPMSVKKELAREIIKRYHSKKEVLKAEEFFKKTFQEKKLPQETPSKKIDSSKPIIYVLHEIGLTRSISDSRRLINSGAVEFEGEIIKDPRHKLITQGVLRVGKKKFVKIIPK
ncbi:MAG: tyrosine--tRNA ligase [Candidatus Niyogibacteria bacterium CG10_big_fil_rev_8_21_14_0_10_42_19]|uniref:Tyrosine--tRNA ligase n=1 Tax=Candidatus Niyogibacteria bacterium CG10_big_fil_rev_8_21_14_0_10_42_19 TaxID=1974725 RepID=A0A2H0TF45_9BACT|nr:MAG: tyrosine--tRNA ligase [Candidatus Niyogibacteria bacterium CG10_big_fil_rev_8_21_14_0_10_42_19]